MKRRREIVEGLASQIERRAASLLWGRCAFRPDPEIPEISKVNISKFFQVSTTPGHWWEVFNAGVVVSSRVVHLLQGAIDEKGKKLDRYLNNCDECWLLLYADRGKKAQRLDFMEGDYGHRFRSGFSRAFFMERYHEDFHELYLTADT